MGWPRWLTPFIPIAIALDLAGASPVVIFVVSALGVLAAPYDRTTVRFVTSLEVDADGVEAALQAAARVVG